MKAHRTLPFRTIGATTCWSADQAEQMLLFLEALHEDIWARYGQDITRQHHCDEGQTPVDDSQLALKLEEPPF